MRQNQFSPNVKDLGEVKVGKTNTVVFESENLELEIENLYASCGCTKPVLKDNTIEVKFTPKRIPVHLKEKGFYISTQTVNIKYTNGDTELLLIKAKVLA